MTKIDSHFASTFLIIIILFVDYSSLVGLAQGFRNAVVRLTPVSERF